MPRLPKCSVTQSARLHSETMLLLILLWERSGKVKAAIACRVSNPLYTIFRRSRGGGEKSRFVKQCPFRTLPGTF